MDTNEAKLPHHLSKEYKSMVELGLINENKEYVGSVELGVYLQSLKDGIEMDNPIKQSEQPGATPVETQQPQQEQMIPISQVEAIAKEAVAKAMSNMPQTMQQPIQPQYYTSKKDYDIDDDIPEIANWELKDRQYRLCNKRRPLTESIRRAHSAQMAMQYLNKKTGKTHTMRWSPNQTSFFIEKQSTNPADILDEEIVFIKGDLTVPANNPNLQKFLHIHPLKGIIFDEYDPAEESRKEVATKKEKARAYRLVDTVGIIINRAICSIVNSGYIEAWEPEQVEEAIYNYVETNPKDYINYCEDPNIKAKGVAKQAIARGEVLFKNYKFYDKHGELIMETDRNKDELDELVAHFNSNAGRQLYDYLLNLN